MCLIDEAIVTEKMTMMIMMIIKTKTTLTMIMMTMTREKKIVFSIHLAAQTFPTDLNPIIAIQTQISNLKIHIFRIANLKIRIFRILNLKIHNISNLKVYILKLTLCWIFKFLTMLKIVSRANFVN